MNRADGLESNSPLARRDGIKQAPRQQMHFLLQREKEVQRECVETSHSCDPVCMPASTPRPACSRGARGAPKKRAQGVVAWQVGSGCPMPLQCQPAHTPCASFHDKQPCRCNGPWANGRHVILYYPGDACGLGSTSTARGT